MLKLPEPTWLNLPQTLALVLRLTGDDPGKAKRLLVGAFIEGEIETRGRCQTFTGGHDLTQIGDTWFGATVLWENNAFHIPRIGSRFGDIHRFDQVRVCRAHVMRWLGADEVPASEDEAPVTTEAEPVPGRKNKRKPEDDAILKNRIETVIARARKHWPDPKNRPMPHTMAKTLCDQERGGKVQDYGQPTVKKILAGTYPAMERLNIPPLK